MRSAAERALGGDRTASEYHEVVATMMEESTKLEGIVEQLLALSRLNNSILPESKPVSLNSIVRSVYQRFEPIAEGRDIRLQFVDGPSETLWGHRDLLEEAFTNVLDNALKVTPANGLVVMSMARENGVPVATITDSGPGISPEDRTQIMRRFHRAQGTAYAGTGLGLAIVAAILAVHRASLEISTPPAGGASFRFVFPAAPEN